MATNEKFILEFATRGVESIERATSKVEGLSNKVNGLAAALLGVGFGAFLKGALDAADRISDLSDATNISVESLLALEKAMDAAGGKGKNLEKAINGFYASISDANAGSIKARDAFEAVGVTLSDLANLSEAGILDKTLQGLAQLPPGAERSRISTELLTKAFNSIDPKKLQEALDPEAQIKNAEATREAAEAAQRLEETYKTLQMGAIQALEPLNKLLGDNKLTVEGAKTAVQGLAIVMGLAFGASILANILAINKALGITATLANLIGKTPLGLLAKLGAVVATGVTIDAALESITKQNQELEESAKKAASAQQQVFDGRNNASNDPRSATYGGKPKITEAQPSAGAAGRRQELDARQKAVIESERRIADAQAEIQKLNAYKTASDLEKIEIDRVQKVAQARADIASKDNLSTEQRARELAAKIAAIDADASQRTVELKKQQEAELASIKNGYLLQINQMLGIEQTEVAKVTAQIAQQPERYKEIKDRMIEMAEQQDVLIAKTRQQKLEQELLNDAYEGGRAFANEMIAGAQAQALRAASTQLERDLLEEQYRLSQQLENSRKSIAGYQEASLAYQVEESQRTEQQIRAIKEYEARLASNNALLTGQSKIRQENLRREYEESRKFSSGWKESMDRYVEDANNAAQQARTIFDTVTRGMEDLIVNFVRTGKLGFKDLANTIIVEFTRIQAKRLIAGLFGGGSGASAGDFLSGIVSGILPGRAIGGPVSANTPYLIGERGPEVFVPTSAGTVIPNNRLGGNTAVTYNINAVDAASFRQMLAREPEFLYAVTERGRNNLPVGSRR